MWNTVGEDRVNSSPYDPANYSENQWKDAFHILKTTNQYVLEYFGDLAILNCAHSIKKDINIPWQIENASADGSINVIYVNALDLSNVRDTNIPLVKAHNGNYFESLIPVSDKVIEQTIDLV